MAKCTCKKGVAKKCSDCRPSKRKPIGTGMRATSRKLKKKPNPTGLRATSKKIRRKPTMRATSRRIQPRNKK